MSLSVTNPFSLRLSGWRTTRIAVLPRLTTAYAAVALAIPAAADSLDPRLISSGLEIPSRGYADQPYVVQTDDGGWLCVMTTGSGREGDPGQTVVSLRSTDRGRTWSEPLPVEPDGGPEASSAVLLKVPGGRIYAFYNHNTDDVREVRREDGGVFPRVDSLGHYVFRFTDDHGRSWSPERHEVPVREFACDRDNGLFLCWFHNHGGRFIGEMGAAGRRGRSPYDDRNPAWLMAGREVDTPSGKEIERSEPEILLYDDDPSVRISYPDLIEENGSFFITETQRNRGRVHEIPRRLLDGLFGQWEARKVARWA